MFKNIGKRFTFGWRDTEGTESYYFITNEITGNKYGTPSPVPFRVVDERAGIDLDIGIRCFGAYSYRITNPLLFYTNVCGNVSEDYTRDKIDDQLKSELLTALQPAFARVGETGVRYSRSTAHTKEISKALNDELSAEWKDVRGLEIVSFGVSSVKASEEDEQMIKEMQREAAYMDPTRAPRPVPCPGSGDDSSCFQYVSRSCNGIYGNGAWHSRQAASMRRACMRWGSSNRWRHSRQQRMRQHSRQRQHRRWKLLQGAGNAAAAQ